ANTATGGLACTSNGTTLATCTIAGILTFTDTYGGGTYVALTPTTDTLSLNAAGTQLTVTIKTATGGTGGTTSQTLAAVTAIAGTATVGIRDIQGNLLAVGATGVTATGSF
ncbi:MAG: hypothetical protein NTV24_05180, partial [Candidatus Woesebacteria bacterium]|nr:hypothetical protein [Candidatus Woesebacteria bacterium]